MVQGAHPPEIDLSGEPVVWVNRAIVEDVFAGEEALGRRVSVNGTPRRVVGIVEDVPFNTRGDTSRKLYMPHAQYNDDRNWALIQTVRKRQDVSPSVEDEIRRVVAGLDGQLVVHRPESFESILSVERAQDRFATSLVSAFALLALLLAVLGTYGVLAGSVSARTREIGIRMALGADRGTIRQMVLRYATTITVAGIGLGLLGATIASRWLEALLFGVEPTNPWAYAGSALVFLGLGLTSGWIPARRATHVDTVQVLNAE